MKNQSIQSVFRSPKWQVKPKLHRYPPKRWGHTGVVSKNKLFIYGGKTGKLKEPLYEIDCGTFETHFHNRAKAIHAVQQKISQLYGVGAAKKRYRKYLNHFVKNGQFQILVIIQVLNDCISVTLKDRHCFWSQIAQFPMLKQRQSHATTVLKDKYIVLYGGCNQDQIYEDLWVFNTDLQIWFEIKSFAHKIKKRVSCTITTVKDSIYMFGGQTEDQIYQNEIYCLTFSDLDFSSKDRIPTISCQKIIPITPNCPSARSSHSSISYMDRYLIIMAGQGQGIDSKGKSTPLLLNDVWCFDTERNYWQPIDIPTRNLFKPRSCFSASLYRNKIYVFGGLLSTQNYRSSDQLLILSFSQVNQKSLDVCNLCKLHYKPMQNKFQQKSISLAPMKSSFQFSLKNLYKISRSIKNPFDAICLIIEAFYKMKYQSVALDIIQGKIIMIQGLGIQLSQQKFQQMVTSYQFVDQINVQDKLILEALQHRIDKQNLQIFNFNLKNACSRLGANFLFINQRGTLIDTMLITPESVHYCEFNTQDNLVGYQQQRAAQIIRNYMQRNNLNTSLINPQSFTIVVTDLQRISPTQSEMRVNGKDYVQLAGSNKKTSLQTYCSTLFLRKPQIKVTINNKFIDFRDFESEYSNCFYEPSVENDLKRIKLMQAEYQGCIYMFRDGIRVGKFIDKNIPQNIQNNNNKYNGSNSKKNKQRDISGSFVEGYVEISLNYQLNLLRYRVQNRQIIERQLEAICQQFKQTHKKRNNLVNAYELQEGYKKL